MDALPDHERRIAAALCGAAAAQLHREPGDADPVHDMFAVAESIAACGGLDVDDLRQRQLSPATGTALLLRVLPFGLATPMDRPRLRRDAYRCAAAAGADEGTALVCVAAALVGADLMRFDPVTTALRVRQSLLEDAPMALLNRLTILAPESDITAANDDPGAALQVALSVLEWTASAGVAAAVTRCGEEVRGDAATLAAALAGAASGICDGEVAQDVADRAGRAAGELASLAAGARP